MEVAAAADTEDLIRILSSPSFSSSTPSSDNARLYFSFLRHKIFLMKIHAYKHTRCFSV
jgi:hypothetical protein